MSQPKMTCGIIGTGAFAQFCLLAYKKFLLDDLKCLAIFDQDLLLARKIARVFNIPLVCQSNSDIFNQKELDIIIILTPPNTHFQLAKMALESGHNILIEKPIAFNETDANDLIKLARKKNLQLSANFVLRFHPFFQRIRQINISQRFGQLIGIASKAHLAKYPDDSWYWKEEISGGFFLNTFCHFFDLYGFVSNKKPCNAWSFKEPHLNWSIVIKYPNFNSNLFVNLNATNKQEKVSTDFIFEKAIISTEDWFPSKITYVHNSGRTTQSTQRDKKTNYQKALALVMQDLMNRINHPKYEGVINNLTLLESVKQATIAQKNQLG